MGFRFHLVGGWKMVGIEKWRDEKLLCLVEKKNERTIHVVHINLLLCPYYIKKKWFIKSFFFFFKL